MLGLAALRVEGIAQAVAQEGKGEHNNGKHQARQEELAPVGFQIVNRLPDHLADAGVRRLDAQTQQAEHRFVDHQAISVARFITTTTTAKITVTPWITG